MIKTYRPKPHSTAVDKEGWGAIWESQELSEKYLGSVVWDGYAELFSRYLPSQAPILEAGCGLGKYVIYLKRNGFQVVGVDLEYQALWRAETFEPGLALSVADVASLPIGQGAFDAYISLGVVEHFESGPEPALAEAYRVLRQGGLAFISVPYQHLLKDLSLHLAPSELHHRVAGITQEEERRGEKEFYQYAFTRREITQEIRKAGFRVLAAHPCSRLHWFLHRSPIRLLRARLRPGHPPNQDQGGGSEGNVPTSHVHPKRTLALVPRLQHLIPGWLAGHMLMVVARRE